MPDQRPECAVVVVVAQAVVAGASEVAAPEEEEAAAAIWVAAPVLVVGSDMRDGSCRWRGGGWMLTGLGPCQNRGTGRRKCGVAWPGVTRF